MTMPVKKRFNQLSSQLSSERTPSTVFVTGLTDQQALLDIPKRQRASISVQNLGTHILTTGDIHLQVVAAEALRALKKRKGKGKVVRAISQGPSENIPYRETYRNK